MSEQQLYEILYTSELEPGVPVSAIAHIVRLARARNAKEGITSVLVFDGARFCHYIEGPPDAVHALALRIAEDGRHTEFRRLHAATRVGPRRLPDHPMSYGLALNEADVDAVVSLAGVAAADMVIDILPRLELEP
ncbi:BLUF domain-containing protein [Aquincola sp. MAHUQ-54]|uniref:BLUF domain-containing protein n=1 Tax=Aquincola agrisoli TaxID=3119538 RepID=A0AAW9QHT9_9BURK